MAEFSDEAAINFLSSECVKALLSRGEELPELLHSFIRKLLESNQMHSLSLIWENFETLKRYTHQTKPDLQGMYLKLFHGRTPVDLELDDWGDDGPWIGPIKWFHCTYMTTFNLGFSGGEEFEIPHHLADGPSPIYFCNGMIYFDGVYYGDWDLHTIPEVVQHARGPVLT